ncbi:hypothetical protein QQ045_009823 [Rhodiola kirilowii]
MRQVGLTFFNDFLIEEKLKYACDTTAAATEGLGFREFRIGAFKAEDAVGEIYQNITISYYPPCLQPELTLGL